jgi:hypothetical protein
MKLKSLAIAPLALAMLMAGGDAVEAAADATTSKSKKCAPGFTRVKVKNKLKCRPAAGTRGTLTWNNSTGTPTDLDLVAWDAFGNRAGGAGSAGIPNSDLVADNQAFGPEVFNDFLTPSVRNFTFGVCMSNDNGTDDTVATLVFRGPDGLTRTVNTLPGQLADDHSFALLYRGSFDPGPVAFCA